MSVQVRFPIQQSEKTDVLQRIIRQTGLNNTQARQLTRNSKMAEHFEIEFTNENCKHSDSCGCEMTLVGRSPLTQGFTWRGTGPVSDQYRQAAVAVASYAFAPGTDLRQVDELSAYFLSRVKLSESTVSIIHEHPKFVYREPNNVILCDLHPEVMAALREADYRALSKDFPIDLSYNFIHDEVWNEPKDGTIPSLQAMILKKYSMVHVATGRTNGRPHVISAMDGMNTTKFADSVLKMDRPVKTDFDEIRPMVTEILNTMYRMMRIDLEEKTPISFSLKPLDGMYLGASKGFDVGPTFEVKDDDASIKVSPQGKKIDTFEQDIQAIIDFILNGKEPAIWWTVSPKNENFFGFTKQWSDDEWYAWKEKIRSFYIPNSIYILLEKLVSTPRMKKDRGWVNCIGHPGSRGGADQMALRLGIDDSNCYDPICEEGDFANFDATVPEQIIELYWSATCVYHDPKDPDYQVFEMITKFLLRNMLNRLTRLFGNVWGSVKGGVPSGAFNTSNMDSWICLFYFTSFLVYQTRTAPPEDQEELEELMYLIMIIIYGDDHASKIPQTRVSHYFSEHNFAAFMHRIYNCSIRGIKSRIPFLSREMMGYIIDWGLTFLKHQFVPNPYRHRGHGQSKYLPYRETREYIIRAVWGRETRPRDCVDVMLSVIGHAWGTYASNLDAYNKLHLFYQELLRKVGSAENAREMIKKRLTNDDLKKLRQLGITDEELYAGFPTLEQIIAKNVYDPVFQDNSKESVFNDFHDVYEWY